MHHTKDEIKARLADLRALLDEQRMNKRRIWIRLGCGQGNEDDYSDVSIGYFIGTDIAAVFKSQWASKFAVGKELSTGFFRRRDDQRHYVTLHNAGEATPKKAPSDPDQCHKLDKTNNIDLTDYIRKSNEMKARLADLPTL